MTSNALISLHTSPLALPGSGDSGGMNVYVRELAAALAAAGVESRVYVRRTDRNAPREVHITPGFTVVHIDAGPVDWSKERLPEIVEQFAVEVAADIEDHPADVVHANYWLSAVAGHQLKHQLRLPLVSTFHTLARVKAQYGDPEPDERARAEAQVIGCSDLVTASCRAEADQLRQLYGAEPDRIEVVSPGVDHEVFRPGNRSLAKADLGLSDRPVLLFVGRIQPLKGLGIAIETLAEGDPDAVLVVVGGPSGPDGAVTLEKAHALADELDVAHRIRWVEPQPHTALPIYYRAADVCLVPSRSESFGLVALEAAACGTPVVAADVGGLTTLVDHGRTGYLVGERDASSFACHVAQLLTNPDQARAMGRQGAQAALQYTWSVTAARLRRVYADLSARALVDCP